MHGKERGEGRIESMEEMNAVRKRRGFVGFVGFEERFLSFALSDNIFLAFTFWRY